MRRFRGALNYILNVNFKYMLQKIFSDKIVSNFDSQEVGPKWHFLSTVAAKKNAIQSCLFLDQRNPF